MADISSVTSALHPGIAKLRQQLAGLLPDAAPAASATAEAARPTLLQQAMDNAPLLLDIGTTLLRWVRGGSGEAAAVRQAPLPPPPSPSFRRRVLRPVVIAAVVCGAAYLVSRAMRPAPGSRQA